MKRLLIPIGVFLGLLVLAGLIMELVKTDRQEYVRYMRTRNVFQYTSGNVVFDPMMGYRVAPELSVPFNNTEFTTTVHTNALGFRDDDVSLQNPDVLFLGDSYAWGWGVDEPDGAERQYEKITGRKVLNMATPGYGNVQELLVLYKWSKVAAPQGKQIFLFFCANDIYDNGNTSFNAFPYFTDAGGHVSFSHPSQEGFDAWQNAVRKWTIDNGAARASMLAYYSLAAIRNLSVKDIYKDYQTDATRVGGGEAFMLVAENLAAFANKFQDQVTIVYVPPAALYKTGVPDRALSLVQQACNKFGFRFADLSSKLVKEDYYPLDQHWKASAHKKVAEVLAAMQ